MDKWLYGDELQFVLRLERTEGIAGQRVTRKCEGPRTGTTAYPAVLASTAFALELTGGMQGTQKRGMPVNINEMIDAHVASYERQETGRVNVTFAGYKYDAIAVANPKSAIDRALLDLVRRLASFLHSIERQTAKRRSLRRFNLERCIFRDIEHPVHTFFALFRSKRLQRFAGSDRNQEEKAPAHNLECFQQFVDLRQIVCRFL
jgi:hypothetical protein